MLIQAVIEPPEEARDHLARVLLRHLPRADASWFRPPDWRVRLATFGYLAFGDMVKLEDTMRDQVAKMPPIEMRMRRIVPLPEERDDSIWAELEGDLDALETLAQEITGWVHGLGYLLDRYSFRPRVRLARVTSRTTLDYLEQVIAEVGEYSGPTWTADGVQIVRRKPDGTPGTLYKTHVTLDLATALVGARTSGPAGAGKGSSANAAARSEQPGSAVPQPRPGVDSPEG